MMRTGINQSILLTKSSYNTEQLSNIHPRLCTLHKWSHFDGYGIHLSYNVHWHGLHIDDIEPKSPAESAGLLREDIIIAVNGRSIENEDFVLIFSFIQQELEQDQIRFLVLDPRSAELAQHYQLNIDENHKNCIRTKTSKFIKTSNNSDQGLAQKSFRDKLHEIFPELDPHNNLKSEPRVCSITFQSTVDPVGISVQSDTDFSHIITQVQPNSLADRAGIEPNDCIISLDNILLLEIPFEDVLYHLAKIHNETKHEFIVAKKSYLLQLSQNNLRLNTKNQISTLKNLLQRNRASTLLDEQSKYNQEQNDSFSLKLFANLNISKHKKRHGKIAENIGPARAHRFSWSATSDKTTDYSSIRSDLYGRRLGTNECPSTMKDILNLPQVGMTNPSQKSQIHRIPSIDSSDEGQSTSQSSSFVGRSYNPSKALPSPNLTITNNRTVRSSSSVSKLSKTIQNILNIVPITPILCIENQTTMPLSEFPDHGYEFHNIKLIKPTETIPIGFKLTKQTDSFQYIITDIIEQSQADLAGLKVNDWLIKIEDNDIRSTDLQDIYQLFNKLDFINMLIARKKSSKNILSTVGLSNPNKDKIQKTLSPIFYETIDHRKSNDFNNILFIDDQGPVYLKHCIIKKESSNDTLGFSLYYENGFHRINNVENNFPGYNSGLCNHDIILFVNKKCIQKLLYNDLTKLFRSLVITNKIIDLIILNKNDLQRYKNYRKTKSIDWNNILSNIYNEGSIDNGTHVVQQYQRQRTKELSYTLRLCHLNTTNIDDPPESSLGFEITGDSEYEYPIISYVESKLPGERAGLQKDDVLLKVNDRKTKGANFDKIKKAIDKAKRDGRLEMLVVDKDTFNYCIRTNKKFKEPYIKVKHIFPRSRSSMDYKSLPLIASRASLISMNGTSSFDVHRLSTQITNKKDDLKSSNFETTLDSKLSSSTVQNEISTNESIIDSVLNAINNSFQNTGLDKSINLDYDFPPDRINNSKTNTPLPPALSKEIRPSSQSHNKLHSNHSVASYDYIKDPRRCVLKIDRNKGLGFVLSATGDYDHTITAVDKNSIADAAGLQINDEVVEINGTDVRNIKYEQVVDMLISAMRANDTVEMYVIDSHVYPSTVNTNKGILNGNNNNNNNNLMTLKHTVGGLSDDLLMKNIRTSPINRLDRQTLNTSYSDLYDRSKYLNSIFDHSLNGSRPTLSTGITASPNGFRSTLPKKESTLKVLNNSKKDAPIARLCRIRKCPSSPFYGFFLCGNPNKLGHVFVSNVTKNSSAAICGLRDGDRIIEVNGANIQTLTYQTILNNIKLHMEHHDLEILVLDKKSLSWYRKRNHPITSQTLPTIVHIEPIINDINSKI